jgi:hypothetical protein
MGQKLMAVDGDATFKYLAPAVVTGPPFSAAMWVTHENVKTSTKDFFCYHDPLDINKWFRMRSWVNGTSATYFRGQIKNGAGALTSLTITKGYPLSGGQWFICWVSATVASHKLYWEEDSPVTSTTSRALNVTASGSTRLLATTTGTAIYEQMLDKVAVWNTGLAVEDVTQLSRGARADTIRRDALVAYWAMDQKDSLSPIPNLIGTGGDHMVVTGTPVWTGTGAAREVVQPAGIMG